MIPQTITSGSRPRAGAAAGLCLYVGGSVALSVPGLFLGMAAVRLIA